MQESKTSNEVIKTKNDSQITNSWPSLMARVLDSEVKKGTNMSKGQNILSLPQFKKETKIFIHEKTTNYSN